MIRVLVSACLLVAAPAAAQTQTQMNAQAGNDYKSADTDMTAQWTRIYAAMKQRDAANRSRGGGFGYAAATLESQRAWISFRDKQCVIEAGQYAGGSMQPMVRAQCLTRLTKERTRQLAALDWNH
jgi:uncharacterized protein YecT (DUF1311 family)